MKDVSAYQQAILQAIGIPQWRLRDDDALSTKARSQAQTEPQKADGLATPTPTLSLHDDSTRIMQDFAIAFAQAATLPVCFVHSDVVLNAQGLGFPEHMTGSQKRTLWRLVNQQISA